MCSCATRRSESRRYALRGTSSAVDSRALIWRRLGCCLGCRAHLQTARAATRAGSRDPLLSPPHSTTSLTTSLTTDDGLLPTTAFFIPLVACQPPYRIATVKPTTRPVRDASIIPNQPDQQSPFRTSTSQPHHALPLHPPPFVTLTITDHDGEPALLLAPSCYVTSIYTRSSPDPAGVLNCSIPGLPRNHDAECAVHLLTPQFRSRSTPSQAGDAGPLTLASPRPIIVLLASPHSLR